MRIVRKKNKELIKESIMGKKNFKKRAFVNVEEFAKEIMELLVGASGYVDLGNLVDKDEIVSIIEDSSNIAEVIENLQILFNDNPDIFVDDVIGNVQAMEYLLENDPSLHYSLEIAAEFGYEVKSLCSETLATLLQAREAEDEFYENWNELVAGIELVAKNYMEE